MRSHIIAGLAASAAVFATGASASPSRHDACIPARIGGQLRCLEPGLQCKRRYEHVYNFYGLTCKRDSYGRFRLRDRWYIGPPVPEPDGG